MRKYPAAEKDHQLMKKTYLRLVFFSLLCIALFAVGCENNAQGTPVSPASLSPTTALPISSPSYTVSSIPSMPRVTSTSLPLGLGYASDGVYGWVTYTSLPMDVFNRFLEWGLRIHSIAYGEGVWGATMSPLAPYLEQQIITNPEFPVNEIEQAAVQGYIVTSAAYGDSSWVVVLSKGDGLSPQSVEVNSSIPESRVENLIENGSWITLMAFGNDQWVIVFSPNDQDLEQQFTTSDHFPTNDIDEAAEDGLFLTVQAYGQGTWAIVTSRRTGVSEQRIMGVANMMG